MNSKIKELRGEELFQYMTQEYEDKNYRSIVILLPYATMDYDKAISILEECVRNDNKLTIIYPGLGEKPTKDMRFIGSVPDGGMYII